MSDPQPHPSAAAGGTFFWLTMLTASLMTVAAFFLPWSRPRSITHELMPGSSATATIGMPAMTGKNAGHASWHYGYSTLVVGLLALGLTGIALATPRHGNVRQNVQWTLAVVVGIGLINLTLVLRADAKVTAYGSIGGAIRRGDWTLGYSAGPRIAIVGLGLAAVALGVSLFRPARR